MSSKSGKKTITEILEDDDFKSLRSQKNSISIILTILELVLYFGFIALIAFNREFLSTKISGSITMGIPIAVGAILLSWVLTGIYIRWANTKYDVMVKNLRDKIGG
jgi:uncharacterized membrane protein (DUF485 family)